MGQVTFGIPQDLVRFLRREAMTPVLVETGTNEGGTSRWAAGVFDRVLTVEGHRPLYNKLSTDPTQPKNVTFLFGDSRAMLSGIIDQLANPAVFWLDAHWCGEETFGVAAECPVIEEILAVNVAHARQPGHVIMVDDARLFLEPPPAPHRAEDWPDIVAVCKALTDVPGGRFVFVHRDVVVAVPESLRAVSIEYLRSTAARDRTANLSQTPSLLNRAMRKLGIGSR